MVVDSQVGNSVQGPCWKHFIAAGTAREECIAGGDLLRMSAYGRKRTFFDARTKLPRNGFRSNDSLDGKLPKAIGVVP